MKIKLKVNEPSITFTAKKIKRTEEYGLVAIVVSDTEDCDKIIDILNNGSDINEVENPKHGERYLLLDDYFWKIKP